MRTIKVTKENIREGISENEHYCPVALALSQAFPGAVVSVDCMDITIESPGHLCKIKTPDLVSEWVDSFDLGHDVEPFSFTLDI